MRVYNLIAISLLLCSTIASAAPQVRVVGLFPGAAVLNVDGQRKLVKTAMGRGCGGLGHAGIIGLYGCDSVQASA